MKDKTPLYWVVVPQLLKEICDTLAELTPADQIIPNLGVGRAESELFEDYLKEQMRAHEDTLITSLNSKLPYGWVLIGFEDIESNATEASKRTMGDFSLILQRPDGSVFSEVVNVKATKGGTADNCGGWSSMGHVLFGPQVSLESRGKLLSHIQKELIEGLVSTPHDYFILTFKKGVNAKEVFSSAKVNSYLTTQPESFSVNTSQSFPVQLNSARALDNPHELSLQKRQRGFANHILSSASSKIRQVADSYEKAATILKLDNTSV